MRKCDGWLKLLDMIENYYNLLAPYYKLIYPDWDASVRHQAYLLDGIIREYFGEQALTILDAACGIGTQSIGLAQLGYQVTASDLSPAEIEQARAEALRMGVEINFHVADMRTVWETYQQQFDVVIACDNAVPHLLNDDEILLVFKQFYLCAVPGGGCIITVRDYAQLERKDQITQMAPRLVHHTDSGQIVMFDLWHFDGDTYEFTTYT